MLIKYENNIYNPILTAGHIWHMPICPNNKNRIKIRYIVGISWKFTKGKKNLRLITDRAHHWAFFQRDWSNHRCTLATKAFKFSGSLLIIWSNSANFPGRKNTLVNPNLKSASFNPSALNKAYDEKKIIK